MSGILKMWKNFKYFSIYFQILFFIMDATISSPVKNPFILGDTNSSPVKNQDNYVTFHWSQPILTYYGPEHDGKGTVSGVIGGHGGVKGQGTTNANTITTANNDYKFDGDVYYVDSP